jgi:hypothetical protein
MQTVSVTTGEQPAIDDTSWPQQVLSGETWLCYGSEPGIPHKGACKYNMAIRRVSLAQIGRSSCPRN